MTALEKENAAKEYVERWKEKGYEKEQFQEFWIDLLKNVLGIEDAESFIHFQDNGFSDAFIPSTKVLIEQKSMEQDIKTAIKQADGSLLSPFQQAQKDIMNSSYNEKPRWIVLCNYKSFLIYDLNNPNNAPEEILLNNIPKEYDKLSFLIRS